MHVWDSASICEGPLQISTVCTEVLGRKVATVTMTELPKLGAIKQGFPNSTQGGCIQTKCIHKIIQTRISVRLYVGIKWYKHRSASLPQPNYTSHVEWIKCMPRAQNCLQILVEWLQAKSHPSTKGPMGHHNHSAQQQQTRGVHVEVNWLRSSAVLAAPSTGRRHWHTTVERSSSLHGLGVCHSLRKPSSLSTFNHFKPLDFLLSR